MPATGRFQVGSCIGGPLLEIPPCSMYGALLSWDAAQRSARSALHHHHARHSVRTSFSAKRCAVSRLAPPRRWVAALVMPGDSQLTASICCPGSACGHILATAYPHCRPTSHKHERRLPTVGEAFGVDCETPGDSGPEYSVQTVRSADPVVRTRIEEHRRHRYTHSNGREGVESGLNDSLPYGATEGLQGRLGHRHRCHV